jgi:hypothetical protein
MDDDETPFVKKRGRPKGRKDGPRREGAPKRGRPTKKTVNDENLDTAVIQGAYSVSIYAVVAAILY